MEVIVASTTELIEEIKAPVKDVEKIIHTSFAIVKEVPDFLNNCVAPGTWVKDLTKCFNDFEGTAISIDKFVVAVQKKEIPAAVSAFMEVAGELPLISKDCFNKEFPINPKICIGDVMNIVAHIQNIIKFIQTKPIDEKAILSQLVQIIELVPLITQDCAKKTLPTDWIPCLETFSDMTGVIIDIVHLFEEKPLDMYKILEKFKKVFDYAPKIAKRCFPKSIPYDLCIKDINKIADDFVYAVEEGFKKPINWETFLGKIGKAINDFPEAIQACKK